MASIFFLCRQVSKRLMYLWKISRCLALSALFERDGHMLSRALYHRFTAQEQAVVAKDSFNEWIPVLCK